MLRHLHAPRVPPPPCPPPHTRLDLAGTLALVAGGAAGMEAWARWAHKALWHDFAPGWALHKSHHQPRLGPFEARPGVPRAGSSAVCRQRAVRAYKCCITRNSARRTDRAPTLPPPMPAPVRRLPQANDLYAVVNAAPAIALCLYGFVDDGLPGSLAFGAGLGITLFGIWCVGLHARLAGGARAAVVPSEARAAMSAMPQPHSTAVWPHARCIVVPREHECAANAGHAHAAADLPASPPHAPHHACIWGHAYERSLALSTHPPPSYMFVHDGLVHNRFPVGPIADLPAMQRVVAAHKLHHRRASWRASVPVGAPGGRLTARTHGLRPLYSPASPAAASHSLQRGCPCPRPDSEKYGGVPWGLFLGPQELEAIGAGPELDRLVAEAASRRATARRRAAGGAAEAGPQR